MVNTVRNSMVDLSMANCECHNQMVIRPGSPVTALPDLPLPLIKVTVRLANFLPTQRHLYRGHLFQTYLFQICLYRTYPAPNPPLSKWHSSTFSPINLLRYQPFFHQTPSSNLPSHFFPKAGGLNMLCCTGWNVRGSENPWTVFQSTLW